LAVIAYIAGVVRKRRALRNNSHYQTVPATASIDNNAPVNNTRLSTDENEVPNYEESLLDEIQSNYSTTDMVYEPDTGLPLVDSEFRWSRLDAKRIVLSLSVSILTRRTCWYCWSNR
jgi:hypothetical protein